MSVRPFHLGWFIDGYRTPAWNVRWEGSTSATWAGPHSFYIEMARALERAKFDFLMFEDSAFVPNEYGGSSAAFLKIAHSAPKHDPSVIVPIVASQTSRIGIAPTLSTTEWHPFQLARYTATLDHVSGGRSGWNIVTGSNDKAAQNYGFDTQPPHDERYDRADEFVEVASRLWRSWEPEALIMDRERGYYVDHTKVHTIDFVGKYFRSRGPLTTLPPPQGKPVLLQAGSSERGRAFAARHADVILAHSFHVAGMKKQRHEIRTLAQQFGRNPDNIKFLVLCDPVLGDTDALARERAALYDKDSEAKFESNLTQASRLWGIDLSEIDPGLPIPSDFTTNGHIGILEDAIASGKTLRQMLGGGPRSESDMHLVGSPETVADQLGELVAEIGGDGVLFETPFLTRRYVAEVADGLVPALQRRGLTRDEYSGTTLREHLLEF